MFLKWRVVVLFLVTELFSSSINGLTLISHRRDKRESVCDFTCKDGSCINSLHQCDGKIDCPDASDETNDCRQYTCPEYAFQCAYGACVDSKAECNGVKDCMDNSDEFTLKCPDVMEYLTSSGNCLEGYKQCQSGECILDYKFCNGQLDCADASDESLRRCINNYCPLYAFKCYYGACISGNKKCDDKYDCFDGSDESEFLCGKPPPSRSGSAPRQKEETSEKLPGSCEVPVFEGRMFDISKTEIYPGQYVLNSQTIIFNCTLSRIDGSNESYCINGQFIPTIPSCSRFCSNDSLSSLSVKAACETSTGTPIPCSSQLPPGTVANLSCKNGYVMPNRFVYTKTKCQNDGSWNRDIFSCNSLCGVIEEGHPFISGGVVTNISQSPWHTAIYRRTNQTYSQICGGSIVAAKVVISAAHCFYIDQTKKTAPTDLFQIVAGKTQRAYNATESGTQTSNVFDIEILQDYRGSENNYNADIAILILESPLIFTTYIKPACLPEQKQGNEMYMPSDVLGRVAGWGLTEHGNNSNVLKMLNMTSISSHGCRQRSEQSFRAFITMDKFCAGNPNNSNVCIGDSGGGFLVPKDTDVNGEIQTVYYLTGIVSIGAFAGFQCATNSYTTFTNIQYFMSHFNRHLP